MGFALPVALLALVALGGPLVAHLTKRKELPHFRLPTVELLRRAVAKSESKRRLADRVLLVLRVSMVALLAIGASRPFASEDAPLVGDGAVALVFIVDDSYSMTQGAQNRSALDQAKDLVRSTLDDLGPGSEVALVAAGQRARTLVPLTEDVERIGRALGELSPSARGTDLDGALARSRDLLAVSAIRQRRAVLLTDNAVQARGDSIRWPAGLEVHIQELQGVGETNASLDRISISSNPTTGGRSVRARVTVYGPVPEPARIDVEVMSGSEVVGSGPVDVSDGSGEVTIDVADGQDTLSARIQFVDALADDNARAPERTREGATRLLIVDGEPSPIRHRDEVGLFRTAIEYGPNASSLRLETVDLDGLSPSRIEAADAIVLANTPRISGPAAAAIKDRVEAGAGLLISVGDLSNPRSISSTLASILPARSRQAVTSAPLGVRGRGEFESLSGLQNANVRVRAEPEELHEDAATLLEFDGGAPALLARSVGRGQVLLLLCPLDEEGGDLPYSPGYVPMVDALIAQLTGTRAGLAPPAPGARTSLAVSRHATRAVLVHPDGRRDELAPPFEFIVPERAGRYEVLAEVPPAPLVPIPGASFSLAAPSSESDLRVTHPLVPPEANSAGAGDDSDRGTRTKDLTPWLLLLFGALGIAELWYAVRWRRSLV